MKTLLTGSLVLAALLTTLPAHAEAPTFPDNIRFADVCSYHTFTSKLTCRDEGGNLLIEDYRVFKTFRWTAYPVLPVLAAMKHLGFDGLKHRQVSDDVEVSFARPVTCR